MQLLTSKQRNLNTWHTPAMLSPIASSFGLDRVYNEGWEE